MYHVNQFAFSIGFAMLVWVIWANAIAKCTAATYSSNGSFLSRSIQAKPLLYGVALVSFLALAALTFLLVQQQPSFACCFEHHLALP
jgi:hypothetical protein